MLMRGRWGFCVKEAMRASGVMRVVTPGKLVLKKVGTEEGSLERAVK